MNATKRFIEDAIEGGWDKEGAANLEIWVNEDGKLLCDNGNGIPAHYGNETIHSILLDPTAWQAVGKVRGWKKEVCQFCALKHWRYAKSRESHCDCYAFVGTPEWQFKMHGLIDALCDRKSVEEYLTAIEK